jgi:nitrate/nitrite transporter NarK
MKIKGQTTALVLSTLAMTTSFIVWTVFTPISGQLIYSALFIGMAGLHV